MRLDKEVFVGVEQEGGRTYRYILEMIIKVTELLVEAAVADE